MSRVRKAACLAWITAFVFACNAIAHEGHDDTPSTPISVSGAPRVEGVSDLFEVVGVVDNGTMTVFVDRYGNNEPVLDAKVEIEVGSAKGAGQANADGTYTFTHAVLAQPGVLPVTFTVAAGTDTDLLTGELTIPDANAPESRTQTTLLWTPVVWTGALLILIGAIAAYWWMRRRHVGRESVR